MELFKTARYFSPSKVSELKPTSSDLSSLSAFPCFDSEAIKGMKSELPTCLAAAECVAQRFDPCEISRCEGVKNGVKQSKPKIWKVKRSKAHRKLESV